MSGIRVAVVDDQQLFCSGMQMLIESQPDLEFVGSAHDGAAAVQLATTQSPDVMLMDVRMPVMDGIAATARIRSEARATLDAEPRPKVIVLTTFQRDEAVVRAIHAGADGFIVKDAAPEFVLAAIRTVHAGHSVIAPSDTADLLRARQGVRRRPDDTAIAPLSAREKEVFLLAARGLSNADIGRTAYISEATVKSHVRSILAKLGLTSRVQLVAHAYENGLLG
ncbi:response regulator transcription factor [Microbacterium sp. STN6]|uniref:response regulator n=1 Tax=Microbacterium sp. STN6 TaxID=2995588 RepID=UPI0022609FE7|nr:response regulator transcription factor [Microbacterium sp. STN6]MCX7522716.1 response regulator transcription factor [Microbacterium sp. STN6]